MWGSRDAVSAQLQEQRSGETGGCWDLVTAPVPQEWHKLGTRGWKIPRVGCVAAGAMPGLMAGAVMSLPARQLRHLAASAEFVRPQLQPPALDRAVHGRNTPSLPGHSCPGSPCRVSSLPNPPHVHWISPTSLEFIFQPLGPLWSTNIPASCRTVGAQQRCASTAASSRDAPWTPQSLQLPCPAGIPGYRPQRPCELQSSSGLCKGFSLESGDAEAGSFAKPRHPISCPVLQAWT